MLKEVIKFIRDIFNNPVLRSDLEAYILAGNPTSSGDVDRLEKEYYQQRAHISSRYYWHE